jgi:putative two-component system response regulator
MVDTASSMIRVLVVDDEEGNIRLVRRLLPAAEFAVRPASSAEEALVSILAEEPDVLLLDVRMPARDGFELCRELKSQQATRFVPVILVTAETNPEDRLHAIEAGADDFITKPLNPTELRARLRALARVKRSTNDLESAEHVIVSLALTIEARDAYTDGHCQRLACYATAIGQALGLGSEDQRALQRGGYLHDVGKIGIPDAVLLKPGRLTEAEFETMKSHPLIGEHLIGELRSLARVRPIVRSHHERRDGSGYPDGLRDDDIPLLAEIIGLVDVYDAITTTRPYRPARPFEVAAAELRAEVARGWRRHDLTELLLELSRSGRLVAARPVMILTEDKG